MSNFHSNSIWRHHAFFSNAVIGFFCSCHVLFQFHFCVWRNRLINFPTEKNWNREYKMVNSCLNRKKLKGWDSLYFARVSVYVSLPLYRYSYCPPLEFIMKSDKNTILRTICRHWKNCFIPISHDYVTCLLIIIITIIILTAAVAYAHALLTTLCEYEMKQTNKQD